MEEHRDAIEDDDDSDFDNFVGFYLTHSQYVDFEVCICHSSFYVFLIQSYNCKFILGNYINIINY